MEFLDYFLHLDDKLGELITKYDTWVYAILFAIIFIETGLVIWPFLPGDSLLFVAGAYAAKGQLNIVYIIVLLAIAAILGDTLNYFIGKYFGAHILNLKFRGKVIVKQKYIDQTHAYYEKNGPKTIVLARFVPIIRTFAPFVAGVGSMNYGKFISYNVIGGIAWVVIASLAGYFFGHLEVVKNNFELVVLGIVFISVLPMLYEIGKAQLAKRKVKKASK